MGKPKKQKKKDDYWDSYDPEAEAQAVADASPINTASLPAAESITVPLKTFDGDEIEEHGLMAQLSSIKEKPKNKKKTKAKENESNIDETAEEPHLKSKKQKEKERKERQRLQNKKTKVDTKVSVEPSPPSTLAIASKGFFFV